MLIWEDRPGNLIYGYAGERHLFTIRKISDQPHCAYPWRLTTSLPGVALLAGKSQHLARGDAKACARKVMDEFLVSIDAAWFPGDRQDAGERAVPKITPSWARK